MSSLAFRQRSTLVLLLVAPLLLSALDPCAPTLPDAVLGLGLVGAGAGLRLASARCLGRGARVHRAAARGGLVDWGPYAWSRNPLYVAAALCLAGLGFLAGAGPWALAWLPATYLVYLPVILHEEASIADQVGEPFLSYTAAVPRWLGWPRQRERGEPHPREPWPEVLRREKGLLPGLTVAVVAIWLFHDQLTLIRELLSYPGQVVGTTPEGVALIGLLLGAVGNVLAVERKRRKHAARRARREAEEAAAVPVEAP